MAYFSVIIPTYNRASFLSKTIESVLRQQFTDFELIVVDDGSTDHTASVVQHYCSDERVKYCYKENAERGAARNFGTRMATGEYINFFDSDDLMYENHLSTANNFIEKKGTPHLFHQAYDFKYPDGKLFYTRNSFDETSLDLVLFDNVLSCNSVFVRQDIAKQFPFEEDRILASAEDWALWVKLISLYQMEFCNEVTSAVIIHDTRSILTLNIDKMISRDLFLIEYFKKDEAIMKLFKGRLKKFIAERYTFFMLDYSENKNKNKVMEWAIKAARTHFPIVFSKRYLASLKRAFL